MGTEISLRDSRGFNMRFISLASSSRGNAYLLQAEGAPPLLLEAGIPIKQLRDKLRDHGVSLSDLAGCLVSHEHGDHAKAVKDLLRAGVDCWMSEGTAIVLGLLGHHRTHTVEKDAFRISEWIAHPFDLEHDAEEPKGFMIGTTWGSDDDDRMLFIPDTSFVENRFEGVTIIAVEVNYQEEILHENIVNGSIPSIVGRRTRRNHMSLNTIKGFLLANDLSKCREIWALHLSNGNSDECRIIKEIQEITGVPVHVAQESTKIPTECC
jgi:phosphoribosyl 1,2-cyclic phosphodiesterase